jgi:hypothetical protein
MFGEALINLENPKIGIVK